MNGPVLPTDGHHLDINGDLKLLSAWERRFLCDNAGMRTLSNPGQHVDCLVIGGGLLGMLSARELARSGMSVMLLERGSLGQESSWAGGGILSPLTPWHCSPELEALVVSSQRIYPSLVRELERESGIDAQWTRSGMLALGIDDMEAVMSWSARTGCRVHTLDQTGVNAREPELAPLRVDERALWLPDIAQVRNPRLLKALKNSIIKHGVNIKERCEARRLWLSGNKVIGVVCEAEKLTADRVVIAGGAWSEELLRQTGTTAGVLPVRGQMLMYRAPRDMISAIIIRDGHYLIPRRDGHVLVGSTLEYSGFDKSTTAAALTLLRRRALDLVPALARCPLIRQWAGLRPGSAGGIPLIGAHPTIERLYLNCGHFRNGVTLAPASAARLAKIVLDTDKYGKLRSDRADVVQTLDVPFH